MAKQKKKGIHVYLCKPSVRDWPNSRFLTATVLGVQQANRAVEVTEMWRPREKELQLEAKLKERSKQCTGKRSSGEKPYSNSQHIPSSSRHEESMESLSYPPSKSKSSFMQGQSEEEVI